MAGLPPSSSRLQHMLQIAVQSVQWTYSLFWQLCPHQGLLVWTDGYYNGSIKTRKTVQPMEVTAEDASMQRSQQLRELYESLLAGRETTNGQPPTKRPCAALSPEDLTESEWFYLMCVSFSFLPGSGLPGKAYARRQHIWLTGANEVDSKTFSRAILAKSAKIQTVVCIPLLDGVVELGTIDRVHEDLGFVEHIKSFFAHDNNQHHHHQPPPKPALSEHSTSNPSSFHSPPLPAVYTGMDPPIENNPDEEMNEDEEEEEDDEEPESNSAETGRDSRVGAVTTAEPSELMQLDLSEDIRLGSPEDVSNNLDSDFHLLAVSQQAAANTGDSGRRCDSFGAESFRRWPGSEDQLNSTSLQPPSSEIPIALEEEDSNYSQTVSTILQSQSTRWTDRASSATTYASNDSSQSSFATWTKHSNPSHALNGGVSWSQRLLKYIIFTVPFLHGGKHHSEWRTTATAAAAQHDELVSANHVMAERRRREKLNERFVILRSLVPFVTKMDKASILGDTIEYVKQLRKKIQDLEASDRQMEIENRQPSRKIRIAEEIVRGVTAAVEVSIIESDALLEIQCEYREGLLLDILQLLRELRIETTAIQSSVSGSVFAAEIRAKVKENVKAKKASITEVKRAISQIIP